MTCSSLKIPETTLLCYERHDFDTLGNLQDDMISESSEGAETLDSRAVAESEAKDGEDVETVREDLASLSL